MCACSQMRMCVHVCCWICVCICVRLCECMCTNLFVCVCVSVCMCLGITKRYVMCAPAEIYRGVKR